MKMITTVYPMFGYTAAEIIEALEFWGKAKDMQDTKQEFVAKLMGTGVYNETEAKRFIEAAEVLGLIKFKEPEELPIFEVKYPSGTHTYKIWANGRTEGFNKDVIVVNRISQFETQLIEKYLK